MVLKVRGNNYHWVIDLYQRLNLPVIPAVVQALIKCVQDRAAELNKQHTEARKQQRIRMKVARTEDQEARKKWVKQQAVRHSNGGDSEDEEDGDGQLVSDVNEIIGNEDDLLVVSGRKCCCGSTWHQRTSHKDCPLNKKSKK